MVALKQWFLVSVLYKILDIFTTLYLVYERGSNIESNPFSASMMSAFGFVPGMLINGAIVFWLLCVLYKNKQRSLLTIASFLMMVIVTINCLTIVLG